MSSKADSYAGSQLFAGLSDYTGLTTDQLNFIISQLVALAVATLYRTVLHPSKTSTAVRHAFGLVFGVLIGYFCFGFQAIHLAGLPAVCYVVIITQNPHIMHGMVLTVALIYLSCLHLHRQIYDYGSYGLDISGPLMVITQKVSSLAFSLHDGLTKKEDEMTNSQKLYAVYKTPTLMEYFSYMLLFPSLMAGPVIFYNDYMEFIEGKAYTKIQGTPQNGRIVVHEPSPIKVICQKTCVALICAYIFVIFLPKFPISRAKEENFVNNTSMSYKFWYLTVSTTLVRFKYYFAWTLADAICNNSGLGFNGFNPDGSSKWDRFSNVDIFQFEFATSLKQSIEAWNRGTNIWLRTLVYERTKNYPTVLTYGLSAIWHGFYTGYYLTFLSGALFTFASRVVRRHVRNYFMSSKESKLLYDIVTFAVTHFVLAYITFPFVLLDFWPSIIIYNQLYWCWHLGAILALTVIPKFVPKDFPKDINTNSSSIALAFKQANSVGHKD